MKLRYENKILESNLCTLSMYEGWIRVRAPHPEDVVSASVTTNMTMRITTSKENFGKKEVARTFRPQRNKNHRPEGTGDI